jgi:hypothetical protein
VKKFASDARSNFADIVDTISRSCDKADEVKFFTFRDGIQILSLWSLLNELGGVQAGKYLMVQEFSFCSCFKRGVSG